MQVTFQGTCISHPTGKKKNIMSKVPWKVRTAMLVPGRISKNDFFWASFDLGGGSLP